MRTAEIQRDTLETQISAKINLDGTGDRSFSTGLPFLEHMLDQVARHGLILRQDGATASSLPVHKGLVELFREIHLAT